MQFKKGLFFLYFFAALAHAESDESLARAVQNPFATSPAGRHILVPFDHYTYFDYQGGTQNILELKPIVPFTLNQSYDLISRTIFPVLQHQPGVHGNITGIGDLNPTLFLSPIKYTGLLWGAGATLSIPTATNEALGTGKWSAGPEVMLAYLPKKWTFAFLTNNMWSFAGKKERDTVNQFSFQYFINHDFQHGWYSTWQPTITANWRAEPGEVWTVPFGGGGGKVFHLGKQAINLSGEAYYYPIRPTTAGSWMLQLNIEFIFDDQRKNTAGNIMNQVHNNQLRT